MPKKDNIEVSSALIYPITLNQPQNIKPSHTSIIY